MEVIVVIELPCDTCDGVGHAIGLDNMRFTVAQSSIPPEVKGKSMSNTKKESYSKKSSRSLSGIPDMFDSLFLFWLSQLVRDPLAASKPFA
jgi:hypothetical protein